MGITYNSNCPQIPQECVALWRDAVGEECGALAAALAGAPTVSVRFHPLKANADGWNPDSSSAPTVSLRLCPPKQAEIDAKRAEQDANRLEQNILKFDADVPWCTTGRFLLERPIFTLDPHFHAGAYYVQEASSMFLAQMAPFYKKQGIKRVLDLCGAPGGKSTLLAEMLPEDGILVANEVIRSRVSILSENVAKWGYPNVVVTNNDAKDFQVLPRYFDLLLIDAPCSGEGMFRKEQKAKDEWSLAAVRLCAERQRRIVADVWETLRPGGFLIYSTCTFNRHENEENVAWICTHLGAKVVPLHLPPDWGIMEQEGCYRFLPHRIKGEGLFFALLQKNGIADESHCNSAQKKDVTTAAKSLILPHMKKIMPVREASVTWVRESVRSNCVGESVRLYAKGALLKALPEKLASEMVALENVLNVVQSGVAVARAKGKDWAPEPDLALSPIMQPDAFPVVEVDLITARRYLARESITLPHAPSGYIIIQYQGSRLCFAKNIGSRINNLYPQARRIRQRFATT